MIKEFGGIVSPGLQKIVGGPVFGSLQKFWWFIVRNLDALTELRLKVSYWLHLAGGGSFHSWYAQTLNGWAKDSSIANIEKSRNSKYLQESGIQDLVLIKEFGLQPNHTFLECGCGWLRASHHIISHLEHGKYFGFDPASERIRVGRQIYEPQNIEEKNPRFLETKDNSFDWLNGEKFDYIWCHAVFGHLPKDDVDVFFNNVRKAMHKETIFLFTYNPIPDARDNDPNALVVADVRNWIQPTAYYQRLCEKYGLAMEFRKDLRSQYGSSFGTKEALGVARLVREP